MSVDGMDHSKSCLPRFSRDDKTTEHSERCACHITGVLLHGRPTSAFAYTWFDRFPASSDTIMSIILEVLARSEKEMPLPPVLYLHLDNCWRENKNKYMLGLAHYLVDTGVFTKVKICFLPVGHTHDDCDQMFSCFSRRLSIVNVHTLPDLHSILKKSYYPTPQTVHMDRVGLFTLWLLPHLPKRVEGISKPRVFLVKKDKEGVTRHWFRQQMQGSKRNMNAQACYMPANVSGLQMLPNSKPDPAYVLQV
jgi:hypothetical protein